MQSTSGSVTIGDADLRPLARMAYIWRLAMRTCGPSHGVYMATGNADVQAAAWRMATGDGYGGPECRPHIESSNGGLYSGLIAI